MSAAAKHFDPIVGIDIHIIQPPGPVPPVPIPHPHTGMVLDPCDYAPFIGGTVKVGGLQRAQAGTETMMIPKHIPIGGTFVKPPGNEGEVFMGSSTVSVDGDAFTYLALPVLTCHDVGMPAPGRPKGSPPKSLVLPTTVVLAVPAGVVVGGSPTVSLMALGMKAGIAALGKGLKKLAAKSKKFAALVEKGAKAWKKVADKIQELANKAMKKLGIPPALRNKVSRAICSVTGHPVDVATGKVFTEFVDVYLDGPLPLFFDRVWFSTSTYQGPLGHGWHHGYDLTLHVEPDVIVARLGDGRYLGLPLLEPGQAEFVSNEKLWFGRDDKGYWLRDREGLTYRFAPSNRGPRELPLAAIVDRHGNRIAFGYDTRGRLSTIIDSAGRHLDVESDDQGRIRRIGGPHPHDPQRRCTLFSYRYDADGDLVEAIDPLGHATRFVYRGHLLVKETNRNGMSFYFEYDAAGPGARCVRTWGDGGLFARTIRYDDVVNVTRVEDSRGKITEYHHDGAVVHRRIDAEGGEWLTEWDDDYNIVARVDPTGARTTYVYDDRCNIAAVFEPSGAVTKIRYADCGRPEVVIEPDGGSWVWSYDAHGRAETMTDPSGDRTRYEYAAYGLAARIESDDARTELQYDGRGLLATVRTTDGALRRWIYDGLGRVVERIAADGSRRRNRHDAAGRIVRIEEPDGGVRVVAYDAEGNVVEAEDAHRRVTFAYRGMNMLASRTIGDRTVAYEHDREGLLTAVVNEKGLRQEYTYDGNGELVRERDFDGKTDAIERDAAGRVLRVLRAGGHETAYRYDGAGRLVALQCSEGDAESYRYDAVGRVIEAANRDISVRFEYDARGRVVKQWQGDHWVASEFDVRDRRVAMESSLGARQTIALDVMGDAAVVGAEFAGTSWSATFLRDVVGRELERHLPGVRSYWERDAVGRPLRHVVRGNGAPVLDRRYAWDVDHRLLELRDLQRTRTFEHDVLHRLARVRSSDGRVDERAPDEVGNIFASAERFDREYGAAGQVLQSWGPEGVTRYEYDSQGNLRRKTMPDGGQWEYVWSGAGNLVEIVRPDRTWVRFEYDVYGRRVAKRVEGKTTRWLWDGNVPLHEWVELEEAANEKPPEMVTWLFEPRTYAPMARLTPSSALSIVTDHLGTPVCIVDGEGTAVWTAEIDSRGRVEIAGDAALCPFRFPGQYEDEETGLYYNRNRYYDPATGTYVSRDPLGLRGGWLPYGYVDDPIIYADPAGLNQSCSPDDLGDGQWIDGNGRVRDANGRYARPDGGGPTEAYDRAKHYGRSPTAADRNAMGAKPDEVLDHDPPLVQRYYEGDPNIGEKPGYQMTPAERKASAADRSRMSRQPRTESDGQGGKMKAYSMEQKKKYGL